jgi:hypothetical protein
LQLVGILWIVYAGLHLLGALAVLLVGQVMLSNIDLPREASFVPALVTLFGWVMLICSAVGIAAGWGLMQKVPWARLLTLILAFLSLFNLPFGTALGVYSLWVLLPDEAAREYEQAAQAA